MWLSGVRVNDAINRPLWVAELVATSRHDRERGPMVAMNPADAAARLLNDGELAWVYGPRRHELATVHIEPEIRAGNVVLRDISGASPSEVVRVVKPDLDTRGRRGTALA